MKSISGKPSFGFSVFFAVLLVFTLLATTCKTDDSGENGDKTVEKIALNQKIVEAEARRQNVETSTDGTDKLSTVNWVNPAIQTALDTAIQAAQGTLDNDNSTQAKVNSALAALNAALSNYNPQPGLLYLVTINASGYGAIAPQTVIGGQTAVDPALTITKIRQVYDIIIAANAAGQNVATGGYNLDSAGSVSWVTEGGAPWTFTTPITGNMTITAKWTLISTGALTVADAVTNSSSSNPLVCVLGSGNSNYNVNTLNSTTNVIFTALNGAAATITSNTVGNRMFLLGGNASVTIGKNITLTATGTKTASLIELHGDSQFTMLDGSTISNITSDNSPEAGVVITVGNPANANDAPEEDKPTFYMEGGLITGTDTTAAAWKRTWVSVIVITRYGKVIMSGGKITDNWKTERIATTAQRARGDIIPGKQVMGGDIFINAASFHATQPRAFNSPVLEISGTAEVDYIFLAGNPVTFSPIYPTEPAGKRPHLFYIGSNWTGKIGNLIPDSANGSCMDGWKNEAIIGAVEGHTLTGADIDKIQKLMYYPAVDDNGVVQMDMQELEDRRISNSGDNIGYWLERL